MTLTIPRDEMNRKIFRSKELQHTLQNPCRMKIAGFPSAFTEVNTLEATLFHLY